MKTKKWLAVILVLVLVIAVAGFAIAKKDSKEGKSEKKYGDESPKTGQVEEGGPGDIWGRLSERLGIDRETLDKLREIHRDAEKQQIRLRADLQIARMDLQDIIQNAKSSESEIRKAADHLGKLMAQEVHLRITALLQAKKILTPEQYEKVIRVLPLMHRGEMRREMQGPRQGSPDMMMEQRGEMRGRGSMFGKAGYRGENGPAPREYAQWNGPQGNMRPEGPMGEGRFQRRGFRPQEELGQGEQFGQGNNFRPRPDFADNSQGVENQVPNPPNEDTNPSN